MGVQSQGQTSRPIAGAVSARDLLIPAKALKEFKRGRKAYLANDFKSSAKHFEKAVQMYPDFAEAHTNLGSSYLMEGSFEKSLGEFERAIALDPKRIGAYNNLSLAFLLLKRYPDSEAAARRALQIDPRYLTSLSLLGNTLAAQQRYTQEAVDSLRQSRKEIPDDRLTLAEVLLRRGELDQAVAELREYLKVASGPEKQKAQCWLARLTQTDISHACGAP
ncbi:MAG TPA: tetratricopeptide repeat protein [Candidatus Acidoferrum sp.]